MAIPMLVYGAIVAHRFYYGFDVVPFIGPHVPGLKDVRALDAKSDAARLAAIAVPVTASNYSSTSVETASPYESPVGRSLTSKPRTGGKKLSKKDTKIFMTSSYLKKKGQSCKKGFVEINWYGSHRCVRKGSTMDNPQFRVYRN